MKYRHLFIFLFLYLWIFLGFYLSRAESPTWDEPIHLAAGIHYARGNYDFDPIEPPLFRRFVYLIGSQIEKITGPSLTLFPFRAVVVIATGIGLSLLLWPLYSRSLFAGLLGSVLFVYDPNLLAHSHYLTTDAISAIAAVYTTLLLLSEKWKTRFQFFYLCLIFSLTASLKVAALALVLPVLLIKLTKFGKRRLVVLIIFSIIFIFATYGFRSQIIINRYPVSFPFGGYLRAIKENILFAHRGQPIYFEETVSRQAPLNKTFTVFLLKTTLPIMILAFWSLVSAKHNGKLVLIFLIVFLVNSFKPLNFGMRHLLAGEIALILIAASAEPKKLVTWMFFTLVIVWQILSFRGVIPQTLTYTNELAINPTRIFTDSDFDWGQGLLGLRQDISALGLSKFQLAYFGNVDPLPYLGPYIRIKDENPAGSLPVSKLNYALPTVISVTCYYLCGYSDDPLFKYRQREVIAQSFFYFP